MIGCLSRAASLRRAVAHARNQSLLRGATAGVAAGRLQAA